ncbi:phospholipase A1-Igamma1, chloroplastic-like [Solanum verrucosum]|uniref:phospholipase A1-Igamma1, chloroplastic-like n=1 Tax=Solanum verrucosum TaxID=315347 RepID=UPI0020D0AD57|nr:phospholipase A1-Igamma1, chloroplastic-like [Solanum verrucosum]
MHLIWIVAVRSILVSFSKSPLYDLDHSYSIDPNFFSEVTSGEKHGYDVSSYIYYKCLTHSIWPSNLSHQANWIGYVAVSNDEYSAHLGCRDITIAWRKTTKVVEMIADIMDLQRPARDYNMSSRDPTIKIEAGLLNIYTRKHDQCNVCKLSAREQVLNEVKRLIDRYSNEELSITIAGHSLGGGLAMVSTYDIAEIGLDLPGRVIPLCVFSFSGPRVGNIRFKQWLETLGVKVLRVVNKHDFEVQTRLIQKLEDYFWSYWHVGEEIILDHKISPSLKEMHNLTCITDLEVHLDLLNWFQGKGKGFLIRNRGDINLVRKVTDSMIKTYIEIINGEKNS